jgi:hypothetical protein
MTYFKGLYKHCIGLMEKITKINIQSCDFIRMARPYVSVTLPFNAIGLL